MLFFSFSNAGPSSSKWRFLTSGDNANALQAKGDTCSVCDDEGSDVAQIAIGPPMAIAVMNRNIFFMFSTLRVQVDFKSKGISEKNARVSHSGQCGSLLDFRMAETLAISDVARL